LRRAAEGSPGPGSVRTLQLTERAPAAERRQHRLRSRPDGAQSSSAREVAGRPGDEPRVQGGRRPPGTRRPRRRAARCRREGPTAGRAATASVGGSLPVEVVGGTPPHHRLSGGIWVWGMCFGLCVYLLVCCTNHPRSRRRPPAEGVSPQRPPGALEARAQAMCLAPGGANQSYGRRSRHHRGPAAAGRSRRPRRRSPAPCELRRAGAGPTNAPAPRGRRRQGGQAAEWPPATRRAAPPGAPPRGGGKGPTARAPGREGRRAGAPQDGLPPCRIPRMKGGTPRKGGAGGKPRRGETALPGPPAALREN